MLDRAFAFDNYPTLEARYQGQRKSDYPLARLFVMQELDDCGSMCSSVIESYQFDKRQDYRDYIQRVADHVSGKQARLEDGTLVRTFPSSRSGIFTSICSIPTTGFTITTGTTIMESVRRFWPALRS